MRFGRNEITRTRRSVRILLDAKEDARKWGKMAKHVSLRGIGRSGGIPAFTRSQVIEAIVNRECETRQDN